MFSPDGTLIPDQEVDNVEEDVDLINEPITKNEVTIALTSRKNGKAPGPNGIIGEILFVCCFLVKLFNKIFDIGIYPEN